LSSLFERLGRPALFALEPETAHGLSLAVLKTGLRLAGRAPDDPRLRVSGAGLDFPNPLGMAAGYDKNAEVPDALLSLGFGFAEAGTVTPLPQAGNPRPRLFRLAGDAAVINRLGFNNQGHDAVFRRLAARSGRPGIVGVNIGANKDSADRVADYELGVRRFAGLASYLVVNISSPNTPGLRSLQARQALGRLLEGVLAARGAAMQGTGRPGPPLFLKIAPDLSEAELEDIAAEVRDKAVDGVVVSNTTVFRPALQPARHVLEAGGLSGRPLFDRSTVVLARMRRLLGPRPAIIGVGGVESAEKALEKIRAGADLVQLYTALVYGGPGLPARILRGMIDALDREGGSLAGLRDSRVDHWAGRPL